MIVSELIAQLGFSVNDSGAKKFESTLSGLQKSANRFADSINAGIGLAVGNMVVNFATKMAGSIKDALEQIPKSGDAMAGSIAKITSSLGDTENVGKVASDVYDRLYESSQRTGVSADDSAGAFVRFNLAMKDLGRPAEDTIKLLEGLQAAGIVAGSSTAEMSSTMTQLGQALASGKLQGEELKTLRESMPGFLGDVIKKLNMTKEAFFDAATKGNLTPQILVPALLSAADRWREELAKFPIGMSMGFKILTLAATRFSAEIDKQLGLSKSLGGLFKSMADTLNSWRSGLSVIGNITQALGGMERILRLVESALIAVAGYFVISNLVGMAAAFGTIGAAVAGALIPILAFAAAALLIEDFIVWMMGGHSVLGDMFGPFDKVLEDVKVKFEEFKASLITMPDIAPIWAAAWKGIKNTFGDAATGMMADGKLMGETIRATFFGMSGDGEAFIKFVMGMPNAFNEPKAAIIAVFDGLKNYFEELWNGIGERFNNMIATIMNNVRAVGSFLGIDKKTLTDNGWIMRDDTNAAPAGPKYGTGGTMEGGPNASDPNYSTGGAFGGEGGFANFLAKNGWVFRNNIPSGLDAAGKMSAPAPNMAQTNNNNIDLTINAPGSDPASIASSAQSGIGRALDGAAVRLGNSMALGLGMANPRVEAAAVP